MDAGTGRRRRELLTLLQAALDAVDGERAVRGWLGRNRDVRPDHVIAVGKAAAAMFRGALAVLGDGLAAGLAVTKHRHWDGPEDRRIRVLESGHPVPDDASLAAGRALLVFLAAAPADARFLFLVSGGTSALAEVLPEGIELGDLGRVNEWLLGSAHPIGAVNRVRKGLSCIKAGRLARYLDGRRAWNLMISDVPDDDPRDIGSGLLVAHPPASLTIDVALPDWIRALLDRAPPAPLADDPCFATVETAVLVSNRTARAAVAAAAGRAGLPLVCNEGPFEGDAPELGRRFARRLRGGPAGVYVWGGESTVRLPEKPGRGGRNQALALAAAEVLAGGGDCALLAVGSDGSDGPTDDAGALVDGGTLVRGSDAGLDAADHLRRADAGSFLEASGDLVQTGPTGTNVMDLVIGLKGGWGNADSS